MASTTAIPSEGASMVGRVSWGDPMEPDGGAGFVLPLGTVTLLLADIEGSTRGWEDDPAGMQSTLISYDEIIAAELARHQGVRPRDQGEGDAFVAAFSRASDAVGCATAIQLRLATELPGFRVRMGIHTGEVELRDEGNYAGSTINRCARVRDIAHGGQVVLSQTTRDLVADSVSAIDLGLHRLKDLARPERVWQLCHPDLPSDFPPLRSLDAYRHNLPAQLTPLVGRRAEVAEVRALLRDSRLVTLSGAGGSGKTRLALQVAAESLDDHPDGVWLADLSALTSPEAVAAQVAAAVQLSPDSAPRLAKSIGSLRMLLVLDNCEHLIAESAELVAALLASCPNLRVLATSREILGVPGEASFRVPSLSLPARAERITPDAIAQSDAVRLFIERAVKARPNFHVDDANAPAVAEICHRLDGIPLAIELAAARVRVLSPEQIASGLSDRFRLLGGGARTVMPRQQTLRASVDWSYRLLDEAEQALFRRMALFHGGATLDAAEAVVAGDEIDVYEVLDLLARLADKSLLVTEEDGRTIRYRMLETIRQYAAERLADAPEIDAVRERFAAYWVAFVHPEQRSLWAPGAYEYIAELHREWDNVKAALDDLLSRPDPRRGCEMAVNLAGSFSPVGRREQGIETLELAAVRAEGVDPVLAARAVVGVAFVRSTLFVDPDALAAVERGVAACDMLPPDHPTRAHAMGHLAVSLGNLDPERALEAARDAVDLAQRTGDPELIALHSMYPCYPLAKLGRADEARAAVAEAIRLAPSAPSPHRTWVAWIAGACYQLLGDFADARAQLEVAADGFARLPFKMWLQWTHNWLANLCLVLGDDAGARLHAEQGIEVSRTAALLSGNYAYLLQNLATVSEREGKRDDAVDFAREATSIIESGDLPRHEVARSMSLEAYILERDGQAEAAAARYADVLRLCATLGEEVRPNYSLPLVPPFAPALEGLARLAAAAGEVVRAARLDGAAQRRRDEVEAMVMTARQQWHRASLDAVASDHEARWSAERALGRSLDIGDALSYALGDQSSPAAVALLLADAVEAGANQRRPGAVAAVRALGFAAPLARLLADGDHDEALEAVLLGAEIGDGPLVADALDTLAKEREDAEQLQSLSAGIRDGTDSVARAATYLAKRKGPRAKATSGWDSLTPIERQVVDLVVEGLTNPQIGKRLFISKRTVQGHLARIFPKLAVRSRAELAALASRRN